MKLKALFLTAIAAAMLTATGAMADDWHGDRDHYGYRHDGNRGRDGDHDRYWRPGWQQGRYVDRDRVYVGLRAHGYYRWDGAPYWYQGRYVVRSYDRFGRAVFVEVNPYTGSFVGAVRF